MSEKSFEQQYKESSTPWRYTERGAERLRLILTGEKVGELLADKRGKVTILDIGCSNGELSELILPYAKELHCVDLSDIALAGAKARLDPQLKPGQKLLFLKGSSTNLPVENSAYDFVVCSDGIFGWNLTPADKKKVIVEINRSLKPGGQVLFVDYLKPIWIDEAFAFYQNTPFQVESEHLLGDRVWFKLESALKAVRSIPPFKQILKSVLLARGLREIGLKLGKRGSHHIMVYARKASLGLSTSLLTLQELMSGLDFILPYAL